MDCRFEKHRNEIVNKTWNFSGRCKTKNDEIFNAITGLSGETGEVADLIKKMLFHTEKPDQQAFYRPKMVLELGDVMYYWLKMADLCGISLDEIIAGNVAKLESRHPELGKVEERFGAGAIR